MTRVHTRSRARSRALGRAVGRALALALAGLIALAGCDLSVDKLPLPGGADVGGNPLVITAEFSDVLDLVPQSSVKVADVTVGKVTDVSLDGYRAVVTMQLRRDVHLPDDARADIRQTSLLGEKFVSLSAPEGGGTGELGDHDVIRDTGKNPEVEEVLGALSLLLNGGGVAQLKTIASELNTALKGREGSARSLLTQFRALMRQLDDNKADIVTAIESLNRLSKSVTEQQDAIDAALDDLPAALKSIDSQRADLIKMLRALDRLSAVGVHVISASKTATIDSLQNLTPILGKLAEAGDAFPKSLSSFLTYPFVDEVVGRNPTVARNLHMGDYTNLSITLDVQVPVAPTSGLPTTIPTSIPTSLPTIIDPTVILDDVARCLRSGDLASRPCQRVLASPERLAQLKQECEKPENEDRAVCQQLNALPGGDPTILPTGIPGLPRPGAGPTRGGHGPTVRQLMNVYDADLVSLLIPGMVAR